MRNFILGVIITLLVLIVGGLVFALLGFVPTNADSTPPRIETRLANTALDASMDRHAPRLTNPVPPTDENLIEGMKIYTMNCSVCHGTLDNKPSPLEKSFYPPPPQIILDPMDDPEWHIYLCRSHRHSLFRHAGMEQSIDANKICGRLQPSSPASKNCLRRCRTIGKNPLAWHRQPRTRRVGKQHKD